MFGINHLVHIIKKETSCLTSFVYMSIHVSRLGFHTYRFFFYRSGNICIQAGSIIYIFSEGNSLPTMSYGRVLCELIRVHCTVYMSTIHTFFKNKFLFWDINKNSFRIIILQCMNEKLDIMLQLFKNDKIYCDYYRINIESIRIKVNS